MRAVILLLLVACGGGVADPERTSQASEPACAPFDAGSACYAGWRTLSFYRCEPGAVPVNAHECVQDGSDASSVWCCP